MHLKMFEPLNNMINQTKLPFMSIRRTYLRQVFISLFFLPFLMACNNSNSVPTTAVQAADSVEAEPLPPNDSLELEVKLQMESEQVKTRVEDIFRIVKAEAQSNGWTVQGELLDMCYCTESWNRLLLAVHRKEEESAFTFFDIDYWCMTREPCLVTFDQFVVTKLELGERMTASVAYTVCTNDTYTPAEVDLVFEKGQWRIDNFHNYRYMLNIRSCMRQFLNRI